MVFICEAPAGAGGATAQGGRFFKEKAPQKPFEKGSAKFRVILEAEMLFELLCQPQTQGMKRKASFPFHPWGLGRPFLPRAGGTPK